ncbi:unnamed protein product [Clavelina lepadiformis]|uniref:HTH psq-type domain-containing protein n=1 Tax=Clavelina lepadiformis TaxID=159417 RepID=A0ABP0FCR2_CLALP
MPSHLTKRKTKYTKDDLKSALRELSGETSSSEGANRKVTFKAVSEKYGIPITTLHRISDETAVEYSQTIPSQGFSSGSENPIISVAAIQTSPPDDNVQPVISSEKNMHHVTPNDRSEAAFSADICNDVSKSSPSVTSATTQGYFSSLLKLPDQNLSDDLLNDLVYSCDPIAPVGDEENIFDGSFETYPVSTSASRERENVDIAGPSTSFNPNTVTAETPTKQFLRHCLH